METFSSEIGKKMRSAVKAKLIELGTEGSTGYVDEELPDYVMIMVANKRSKQQMTTDLTLFLGTKTELFVTWLHEVLQKLQEVTVPAPAAKKRKSSNQKDDTSTSKKDKKAAKKEKKSTKKAEHASLTATTTEKTSVSTENSATTTPITTTVPILPTGSIRDVFAEDLLERAKHTLIANADAATHIKKAKASTSSKQGATNEFDIPTITEISSSTTSNNSKIVISGDRAKDLAELAKIQKKIYAAKKHLKELGELKDIESEDEDLLKLRDEGSSDDLSGDNADSNRQPARLELQGTKAKSPIVFDKDKATPERTPPRAPRNLTPPALPSAAAKITRTSSIEKRINQQHGPNEPPPTATAPPRSRERERRELSSPPPTQQKRSVHERLGAKLQSVDRRAPTRREKELYVPAHRRQDSRSDIEQDNRERWRSRERDDRRGEVSEKSNNQNDRRGSDRQETRRIERDYNAQPVERAFKQREILSKSDEDTSPQLDHARHRVISKVIVAPSKPAESSEDEVDKSVNSVIKIKPRPPVSPSRQACKNLLLRAVAEAQRSTILSKPKQTKNEDETKPASGKVKSRLGRTITNTENDELFTKDLRERRLKRGTTGSNVTSSILLRRRAANFIIEVEGNLESKRRRRDGSEESLHGHEDEEYELEPMSGTTLGVQYKPNAMEEEEELYGEDDDVDAGPYHTGDEHDDGEIDLQKTQFVVTLNEDKSAAKLRRLKRVQQSHSLSHSRSPQTQVSSSSSVARHNSNEPSSTTTQFDRSRSRETRRSDIRSRLSKNKQRPTTPLSPSRTARLRERESVNSSPSSNHTPPPQQQRVGRGSNGASYVDSYQRKSTKDIKKIIIKNDTDDDASESGTQKQAHADIAQRKRAHNNPNDERRRSIRSKTPPPSSSLLSPQPPQQLSNSKKPMTTTSSSDRDRARGDTHNTTNNSISPTKTRHIPIKFDLDRGDENNRSSRSKSREHSLDRSIRDHMEERRKISIRGEINNKYDNIPSLSSVALDSTVMRVIKPKERCKYHPNCTKQFCDFYHPTAPCKAFPNCKFADKCMYSHPNCKYDMACTNLDCNFSHSGVRNPNQLQPTAPPLSSHVVPVQNYKTISATAGGSTAMCKYYPNCTKVGCTFFHPKPCKFGKNCINKLECNFYHHELQSKFKWVASAT